MWKLNSTSCRSGRCIVTGHQRKEIAKTAGYAVGPVDSIGSWRSCWSSHSVGSWWALWARWPCRACHSVGSGWACWASWPCWTRRPSYSVCSWRSCWPCRACDSVRSTRSGWSRHSVGSLRSCWPCWACGSGRPRGAVTRGTATKEDICTNGRSAALLGILKDTQHVSASRQEGWPRRDDCLTRKIIGGIKGHPGKCSREASLGKTAQLNGQVGAITVRDANDGCPGG